MVSLLAVVPALLLGAEAAWAQSVSPPGFSSAFVDGTVLAVTFDGSLDPNSASAGSAFTVTATPDVGAAKTINGTGAAVKISGATVIVTLASAVAEGEAVTVSYAKPASKPLQNVAGAEVLDFTGEAVSNGTGFTRGPGFVSAAMSGNKLVVTFDEPLDESVSVWNTVFQVSIAGGSFRVSTGVSVSGYQATATFGAAARHGQEVRVWHVRTSNLDHRIKDHSGNDAPTFGNKTATNNTPPVFSSAAVSDAALTITFDGGLATDAGSLPAATDFAVTVGSDAVSLAETDPVAVSGSTVTLTLAEAVLAGKTLTVGYTPGTNRLKDADNAMAEVPGFSGKAVTNNTPDRAPQLVRTSVIDRNLFLFFNEPLAFVFADKAAFTVNVNGSTRAIANVGMVNGGSRVTLVLASRVSPGQTVTVSYAQASAGGDAKKIQDAAGNFAADLTNESVTNDTPPVFSSAAVDGSALTITFDGALDEAEGSVPAATDFTVTVNSAAVSLAATDPVAVSGRRVTLTLAAAVVATDTLTVEYTQGTNKLKAAVNAMRDVPNFAPKTVTNNTPADTTAPGFSSAAVNETTLVLTFDEDLDANSLPAAAAFSMSVNSVSRTAQSVAISGATVTVTLDARVPHGETALATYDASSAGADSLQDRSGNAAASFSNQAVTNNTPPVFSSAAVSDAALTITFDGALDAAAGSLPAATDFAVTVGGNAVSLAETDPVAVSGSTVTLTLAEAVLAGKTLTVGYTPGTNRLKDADNAMAEVPGFSGKAVTNNTPDRAPQLVRTSVIDRNLFLFFNEPLAFVFADKAAFTVNVNGSTRAIANVGMVNGGSRVTLVLASRVSPGQTVTVSYAQASAGGDAKKIQDAAGNFAADLTNESVTNDTPPVFSSAAVDGSALTITFDGALDEAEGSVPAATDFTVTVNSAAVSLAATDPVAVSGRRVTLTLAAAVVATDTLTVEYTQGTNKLKAAVNAMRDVPNFAPKTVTNNTGTDLAPQFVRALVRDVNLLLFYSEPLASAVPDNAAFTVTVAGSARTVNSVGLVDGESRLTLVLASAVTSGQTVTVSYDSASAGGDTKKIQDAAGNVAANLTNEPVTNNPPPAFSSAAVNGATLTITFDGGLATDAGSRPAATDFAVTVNGDAVSLADTDPVAVIGSTVTLTLAAAVLRINTLTVGYTPGTNKLKAAGTAMAEVPGFTGKAVTNNTPADTTGPGLVSAAVNGDQLVMTFDEALKESSVPPRGSFSVTIDGQTPLPTFVIGSNMRIADRTVTGTLDRAVTAAQSVTVRYTHIHISGFDRVRDLAGNAAPNFGTKQVTNKTPLVFSSAAVSGSTLTITFNAGLDETSVPDTSAFTVTVNGGNQTPTLVEVSGATVVLTLGRRATVDQTVKVSYTPPQANPLRGAAMNEVPGLTDRPVTIGSPAGEPPVIDYVRIVSHPTFDADGDGTHDTYIRNDAILVDVEFSEPVEVTGGGDVRLRLDLGDDDNNLNNSRKGLTHPGVVYGGRTLRFTYQVQRADRDLTDGVWVQTGASNKVVFDAHADQKVVSAATGAWADLTKAGLPTSGDPLHRVDGRETSATGPTVSNAAVNADTLTVVFDKNLDTSVDTGELAFQLTIQGAGTIHGGNPNFAQHPTEITVLADTLTLTLGTPARAGETVLLSYNGDLLQDTNGDRAPKFRDRALTNNTGQAGPSPVHAAVALDTLRLTFDGTLDQTSAPAGSSFQVATEDANGTVRNIAGTGTTTLSARAVTVILAQAVRADERATVSYTKPDVNPLRSPRPGNPPVLSFQLFPVATVADIVAPKLVGGAVAQTGTSPARSRMVLTFDEALDEGSVPASGDFAVTVGNAAVTISDVSVGDRNVLLTLNRLAAAGTNFAVDYTPGTNPIRDEAGNAAAAFDTTLTAEASGAPALQSVTVEGARLALAYNKPLDAGSVPGPEAFTLHYTLGKDETAADRTELNYFRVVAVGVEDSTAVLRLNDIVFPCDAAFTVTYEKPAASFLRSLGGAEAGALMHEDVTNVRKDADRCAARLLRARIGSVILSAERPFATDVELQTAWFAVTASGGAVTVTGAAFSTDDPRELKLTLSRDIAQGETVTVSYTRPEGASGLWDVDGYQLADVVDMPVTNAAAPPTVSAVSVVSEAGSDGVYTERETIQAAVTFDAPVTVDTSDGTPTLALIVGGTIRQASYASGSGTARLVFAYRVTEADGSLGAVRVAASGLGLNGGTITDEDGTAAALAFGSAPGVTGVAVADEADGSWAAGDTVTATIGFAEPVTVAGSPSVGLVLEGAARRAAYAGGSGTDALTFAYTLADDDGPWGRGSVTGNSLDLGGGSILSAGGGLEAGLAHAAASRTLRKPPPPLTAAFHGLPSAHDGKSLFSFELRFSENFPGRFDHLILRDHAISVANGRVIEAKRVAQRQNRRWTITVRPSSSEDVTVTLAAPADCTATGAVCTQAGRKLSEAVTATVPGPAPPAAPAVAPLTASFSGMPAEHDGRKLFSFELVFSENFPGKFDYRVLRDGAFQVTNGRVREAKRVARGRNDRWTISVRPSSHEEVTVTLPAATDCTAAGAVCTEAGRKLANTVTATVEGPALLSVADARAREGVDAAVAFAVSLSREATGVVTVDYGTHDGTAKAGEDYTLTRGTLTFAVGETGKTVSVPILDDGHDEGEETFTLKLHNAKGAWIIDGEATGTIENSDPIPKAWLARFGRTVTDQVLDAVEARLAAPRQAGGEAALAGQALPSWTPGAGSGAGNGAGNAPARTSLTDSGSGLGADDWRAADAMRRWMRFAGAEDPGSGTGTGAGTAGLGVGGFRDDRGPGLESRALTQRDLVTGTSFALTAQPGGPGGGFASLWGRGAVSAFDGREGNLTLDGEVTTGLIGADWSSGGDGADPGPGRWTAGLAIGHSTGTGGYRSGSCAEGNCGGRIEAELTGLYPYAGAALTDRLSVWLAAGHGAGEVTVRPDGVAPFAADLAMSMGAAGVRSEVLKPADTGGLALALKGDGRFTRTESEAARNADGGNLAAAEADVWLLRTGIEGSRRFAFGGGNDTASVTPSFEIGVRLDGGDAETGLGADMGGGLAFADPANGLTLDMKARALVAHEASGFREWGASASFGWDPRPETDRGLSLSLTRSLGASPSGGMDALLTRETLADLAANDDGSGAGFRASGRTEGEIGYGLAVLGGGFTGRPNFGFGLSDDGAREYRIGWRLTSAVAGDPGFEVTLDATRREPANDNGAGAPEHGVMLRAGIRW